MARLTREVIITEKIDGTNAQVVIAAIGDLTPKEGPCVVAVDAERGWCLLVGSRTRYITPSDDNFGFAAWCRDHASDLFTLGHGRHYGEWWGSGIQRGYGLPKGEKRLSLFNTTRWALHGTELQPGQDVLPPCVGLVPVLYRGLFHEAKVDNYIEKLRHEGSVAAPGFMDPEGIVVFHTASNTMFKKTVKKDEQPKSLLR